MYFGRDLLKLSSPAPQFRQSQIDYIFWESTFFTLKSTNFQALLIWKMFQFLTIQRLYDGLTSEVYVLLSSSELNTVLQMYSHQCWVEKDCLSWTGGSTLLNAVQYTLGLLCYEKGFLLPTRTLKFFVGLRSAFQTLGTQSTLVSGVIQPRKTTFYFPSLNFTRFLSAHFSSLSKPVWMVTQPYSSLFFITCENLLRVYSVPASWSFMKVLKCCLQYQPLGCTTSYLPSAGLHDSDQNQEDLFIYSVFNAPHSVLT